MSLLPHESNSHNREECRSDYYRRVDELDLRNGRTLPLYLDPHAFESAVSGLVSAYDSLTKLLRNLKNTDMDGSGLGDSAVASACADFHRAWVAETELTAQAFGIIVELLPRAERKYQEADHDGGTSVDSGTSEVLPLAPPVTEPSARPPSG